MAVVPITLNFGLPSFIFSIISFTVGVIKSHSSIIIAQNLPLNWSMEFNTVKGVPKTTGYFKHRPPAEALKTLAFSPVCRYLLRFCFTNSALGARHKTFLPLLNSCSILATSAIIILLPAPVAASKMQLSVDALTWSIILSTASC